MKLQIFMNIRTGVFCDDLSKVQRSTEWIYVGSVESRDELEAYNPNCEWSK